VYLSVKLPAEHTGGKVSSVCVMKRKAIQTAGRFHLWYTKHRPYRPENPGWSDSVGPCPFVAMCVPILTTVSRIGPWTIGN
jgi:hypothetical protein